MAGRPRTEETTRRTRHLLALIRSGSTPLEASRAAGVKPERVVRLLGDTSFRKTLVALLEGRESEAA